MQSHTLSFELSRPFDTRLWLLDKGVVYRLSQQPGAIGFKIMFLDCVIGRRGITIQLPPSGLAKNIISKPLLMGKDPIQVKQKLDEICPPVLCDLTDRPAMVYESGEAINFVLKRFDTDIHLAEATLSFS